MANGRRQPADAGRSPLPGGNRTIGPTYELLPFAMRGETLMSYDPYAAGSDLPPEYEPVEQPRAFNQARKRVQAPAIALIVVGILNMLWVGWTFFNVGMMTLTPANQFHKQMLDLYQSFPQMQAEMSKRSPDELKT